MRLLCRNYVCTIVRKTSVAKVDGGKRPHDETDHDAEPKRDAREAISRCYKGAKENKDAMELVPYITITKITKQCKINRQ